MILLLDGNSENGAQVWSTLGHYIDWIKAMLSTSKKLNFLLAPYHPTERSKHIQNIIKYIRHIIRTHFNLINLICFAAGQSKCSAHIPQSGIILL